MMKKFPWKMALLALHLVCSRAAAADSLLNPAASDLLAARPLQIGELVTVVITDSVVTNQAVTVKSDTSNSFNGPVGTGIASVIPALGYTTGGSAARTETSQTLSDFSNTLTSRVVEILPGDVVVLQAESTVALDGKVRHIILRGKVRRAEIPQSNIVTSDKLADTDLRVDGNQTSPSGGGGLLHWLLAPFR